jgi:hypothetical protein
MGIERFDAASYETDTNLSGATDLTDRNSNVVLASMREKQVDGGQQFTLVDAQQDAADARDRVATAAAASIIADGRLNEFGQSGAVVAAAIEHQYNYNGGAKAADSLAEDISKKLPNGWTLKITEDADFRKKVEQYAQSHGEPIPDYIRKVELFDASHKPHGSLGVTIQGKGPTKT